MQHPRWRSVVLCALCAVAACSRANPDYQDGDLSLGDQAGDDLAGADLAGADLAGSQDLTGADLTPSPYQLSIADANVTEGDDGVVSLHFKVTLSPAAPGAVTFDYATADGSAHSDSADYLAAQGRLSFPPGETELDLQIPVLGDLLDEADENLTLTISNPVGAGITRAIAVGTIQDDDDPPTVSIDDAAGYEGLSLSGAAAVFRVFLSAPSGRSVSVGYATAAGSAGAADFTPRTGTLVFAAGDTEKQISVPISQDLINEGTETFTLGLSPVTNATIGVGSATGTIYDDDQLLPVLSAASVQVDEGDAGTTDMVFTISTTLPVLSQVTFHVATRDLAARAGLDYEALDMDLTIPAGQTSVTATVLIDGDTLAEANETFLLVLSNPSGATIATPMVLGRIKDDDPSPTLIFVAPSTIEGDVGSTLQLVPVSMSAASGLDVSFRIATMGQTATSLDDFAQTTGLVRIPAGSGAWQFAVPIHGDVLAELNETYRVTASMPVNGKLAATSVSCTIVDDD